jgi:hypothetical protein
MSGFSCATAARISRRQLQQGAGGAKSESGGLCTDLSVGRARLNEPDA